MMDPVYSLADVRTPLPPPPPPAKRVKLDNKSREKKACPLVGCGDWVINIARHLRTRHSIPDFDVKKIVSATKIPKRNPLK